MRCLHRAAQSMGRTLATAAALAVAAVVSVPASARAADQVRYAVVVGNNQGNSPGRALRFAEQEVGKLSDILREWGDFQSLAVVRGGDRHEVENALKTARGKLELARSQGKPTLFLFYYSGHGDNEALELGGSRFPLRDLRTYLETLPADVRLAFVDACQSGALTGVKGGRRAPEYEIRLADPGSVRGMAIVTSSTANELSQESDDLQGSYFSQNIMAGLHGLADTSHDGQVTLSELYQYAFRRTLANTAVSLIGGQHPTYDYQLSGAGEVILTRTRPHDAQIAFPRETGVTYTVLAAKKDQVLAELVASADQDLYLAVPAGEYKIVRRVPASIRETRVSLAAGSSVTVNPVTMVAVAAEETVLRKKQSLPANLLGVHVGLQSPTVAGVSDSVAGSGGVAYTRFWPRFAGRVRGDLAMFSRTDATPLATNQDQFMRLSPALDFLLPAYVGDRVSLFAGPTVGLALLRRVRDEAGPNGTGSYQRQTDWTAGATYGGIASLGLRLSRTFLVELTAMGGAELLRESEPAATTNAPAKARFKNRPLFGATLGAAYGF